MCGVSECDLETSTVRRPRTTRAVMPWETSEILVVSVSMFLNYDIAINVSWKNYAMCNVQ